MNPTNESERRPISADSGGAEVPSSTGEPHGSPQAGVSANLYASALHEGNLALSHGLSVDEFLHTIVLHATGAAGVEHGFVYLVEEGAAYMRLRAAQGVFETHLGVACEPKHGLPGRVWDRNEAVVVDDYQAWSGRGIDALGHECTAMLAVPITSGDHVLGVLGLAQVEPDALFVSHVLPVTEGLAELLAIVLTAYDRQSPATSFSTGPARPQDQAFSTDRAVLDNMGAVVWLKDGENRILRANSQASSIFGVDQRDMEGQYLWEIDPENAARCYQEDLDVLATGRTMESSVRQYRARGSETISLEITKYPYRSEAGAVEGVIMLGVPCSSRVGQDQRWQASREAEDRANRVKVHYLAMVGGEIRGPMNSVMATLGRLLDTELSREQREFTETVRTSTDALLTLINDVLDFSKIEAGNLSVEVSDFDPGRMVEDVLDLMSQSAHRKSVQLASYIEPSVPTLVAGDAGRLRQILVNLVANALRSTEAGEVVILGKTVMAASSAWEVRFEVRDNGAGIDAHSLDGIFDPERALAENNSGDSRFGLAIAHRLVELMGGKMGVDSQPGAGSTFWCTLPFEQPLAEAEFAPSQHDHRGVRVLVVESTLALSQILHRQLTDMRVHADLCSRGDQALEMLREADGDGWPYQVVIVDDAIEPVGGVQLAQLVKRDPALESTRVLLMPPFGMPRPTGQLAAHGVDGVVTKPVRATALRQGLDHVLAHGRGRDNARSTRVSQPISARVLVVEDNRVDQRVASLTLERLGCRVEVAGSGTEALELLAHDSYDVVLLDCMMPGADGYRAAEQIRRREGADSRTPLVGVVARATRDLREQCIAAGMDDCIGKPLRSEQLQAVLHSVLESRASQRIR